MDIDVWGLIQNGDFEEACKKADVEYTQSGNIFPLRNKVYALMHLKRYDEVILLTNFLIKERNGETDTDYIFCGIAHWLNGDQYKAIELWKKAEECKYTDAAGGIEVQIILYFSGVKVGDAKLVDEGLKRIKKILKSKRAANWPGPLGKFILQEINSEQLIDCVSHVLVLRERQLCQVSFVKAIKELESGNRTAYLEELKNCVSYGPAAYLEQLYYLAKGEIEMTV